MSALPSRRLFCRALGALAPVAWPAIARAAGDTYTMRLNNVTGPTSAFNLAGLHFAEAVGKRSNGRLKIEVYPSGQLGTEQESINGLTTGVLDLTIQASAQLIPWFPRFQVFDMPFLFKDLAAGFRVVDGPIGEEFFAMLGSKGIVGLGWGTGGFKELETTGKAVVVPDDMKGMRVRIQGGPVYVATYQALGAIPVTIDLSETYVALQQHTVDAMDINLDGATTGKYYNVIKHVAMLNHICSVVLLLGSKQKIEALPRDLQEVLKQEGKATVPFWRSLFARQIAADITILKSNGVTFTEINYPAFRKAVEPVYASFESKLGADLIERIGRAAGG